MEEIQKKAKKVSATTKEPKTTKKSTAKGETTKAKAVNTAKEPKTSTAKKTTKSTATINTTKEPKETKANAVAKETKTAKRATTSKEPKTTRTVNQEKTAPKASTKKDAQSPKSSTPKRKSIEEIKENREEPKITVIQEKPKQTEEPMVAQKEKIKKDPKAKTHAKGYIEISIGAIICAIIIFGLIIFNVKLGVRAYNVIMNNQNANSSYEPENNISVTQEVGNVLDSKNELVAKMQEKITFPTNVTASIYEQETFSINTIPNVLKLIMGWSKVNDEDKLKSINENGEKIEAIEKETMKESIENIFGIEVKYKDKAFNNYSLTTFPTQTYNKGKVTYNDGLYTSVINEGTGIKPLIYQEIQKVVKYSETILVYVKVAYMDVEEGKYVVYRNFSDGEFEEKLLEITPEELFTNGSYDNATGIGSVSKDANTFLDGIRGQLDTYKYTFTLDQESGEYYLNQFNKSLFEE